ncbi:MAG: RNA 2',3'-cyclic phosphodiesterase [Dehalococcoidia bacterium]
MAEIRSFIAIDIPDEVKSEMARLIDAIRPGREKDVKWVDPKNSHLTLKFLGNIQEDLIVELITVLQHSARDVKPFHLELAGLGAFPGLKSPRVAWVGVGGDLDELKRLQKGIEVNLMPLGFSEERKAFSAHITLGRTRDRITSSGRAELGEAISKAGYQRGVPFTIDSFGLFKSTLTKTGPIYEKMGTIVLDTG